MTAPSPLLGIRRRLWIIALFGIGGAMIGALPQPAQVEEQATTFTAVHTMLINDSAGLTSSAGVSPNQVVLLATTGVVPERVAEAIEFDGNAPTLAAQMSVNFDQGSGALRFSTRQETPERAELLANTWAEVTNAYLVERQDAVQNQRVQASRERLDGFRAELDAIGARLAADPLNAVLIAERDAISRQYSVAFEQDRSISGTPRFLSFTTLQEAEAVAVVDRGLSAPRGRSTRAVMGLLAGLAIGTAIAVVLSRLDRKIRTREQAEALLGMRARAEIPVVRDRDRQRSLVVVNGRHDVLSDSYRTLRNVVGFVQSGLPITERAHMTVIVSPGSGDGKTSLAANLAGAFVESGRRTVAVNTDFRRPRLSIAINGEQPDELPFTVDEVEHIDKTLLLNRTDQGGLVIMDLSSVDGSPGELVRSTIGTLPFLADMSEEIVVDTSPVGATAEPLELVPFADVIVLVVRLGHTSAQNAERTLARLRDLTTAPILLALTGVRTHAGRYVEYGDRPTNSRRLGRNVERNGQTSPDPEYVSP